MSRFGAGPEAWAAWRALGVGDDLLPAVANPDAEIAPDSRMKEVGKTPSRYNSERKVVGIGKWTSYLPSPNELDLWAKEPDYALSVQTRGEIKAIDVDVADRAKAKAIREAITNFLGPCPVRYRENSGKLLIPIRHGEPMPKRVLQVEGGMIEILGDGQQFIAEGYHQSGTRYQWNGTALPEMQDVTIDRLNELCSMLEMCFGVGEWKIAREKRDGQGGAGLDAGADEVAQWLVDNWEVYDRGAAGELFIKCPFAVSHTTDSGPTATAYFPAGTGGYSQGHFVCLHAHCLDREDRDYLDATGYSAGQFADLVDRRVGGDLGGAVGEDEAVPAAEVPGESLPEPTQLTLVRDKQGRIEPTADNLVKLCTRPDMVGKTLAFDEFKDELVWAPAHQPIEHAQWRTFSDADYIDVQIELERRGMKAMSKDLLRSAIFRSALERRIDTAQEWLGRLVWDGVERLESFCTAGWGWAASTYSAAVGRYIWTAMAGRVLEPGVQADMAPILVGAQGARKTSAIMAMVPDEEFYTTIKLDAHDDDTSRRMRGKLVGELEELRGLNTRHIEEIKAWITRRSEGWIPKYKEFESRFKRRLVFFGSTNEEEFLNDPTGERRWLPGMCGQLDLDWIRENRDQLWAEGAAKFMVGGVDWEEAETLAKEEHHDYKVTDSWDGAVSRWLLEKQISGQSPTDTGFVSLSDALSGAVNVPLSNQDRGKEMRMAKVLKGLGWKKGRLPANADGVRAWAYVKES